MTRTGRTLRPAFTLMELLVSILIIFLLMGMLIVGLRYARRSAQGARDTAMVTALRQGVDHFKSEFGFLPPLVKDFDQSILPVHLVAGRNVPYIYTVTNDAATLRRNPPSGAWADWYDPRFSTYSIPYYLIGALEVVSDPAATNPVPVDGVPGLGFLTPKRDGSFEKSGRKFDPFFDVGKSSKALFTVNLTEGRVELRDANNMAVRYYRWMQGNPNQGHPVAKPSDANVPYILYLDAVANIHDTTVPLPKDRVPPNLLQAEFAIVAAGPNGLFGDEADLLDPANNAPPALRALGVSWTDMASRLGISGDASGDPEVQAKIRLAAMKDNVVEAGK